MDVFGSVKTLPLPKFLGWFTRMPRVGRNNSLQRRLAVVDETARFQFALGVSVIVHAAIIFGITFKHTDLSQLTDSAPLEVVLVNARSQAKPERADTLAQANLDGGGNTNADRRAKSPLPVLRMDKQVAEVAMQAQRVEQLEREARQLMTQAKSPAKIESSQTQSQPQTESQASPTPADIRSRSLEIARLEAQISKNWDAYQRQPRRRLVGARTQEFRFASYIEDWRLKIERVGTLNYPQAARDQKIYGSLMLTVHIRADGSVEKIEINRPSGQKVLDEAAVRIVKLAAPFAAFPADIAKDTDILAITRTWIFTRSDQLVAE